MVATNEQIELCWALIGEAYEICPLTVRNYICLRSLRGFLKAHLDDWRSIDLTIMYMKRIRSPMFEFTYLAFHRFYRSLE